MTRSDKARRAGRAPRVGQAQAAEGRGARGPDLSPWAWTVLPLLAGALAVATEPARFLGAWNGPPAPGLTAAAPLPPPPGDKRGLALLLVDGLGLAASRGMKALDGLRTAGADIALTAVYPSKTRPAIVTYLTGVPPALSGVRTNAARGAHGLDTLLHRARAAGLATSCVGDRLDWFAELAGGGCDEAVRADTDADFVRLAARALDGPARVVVLHWLGVDWQGHAHGGASGEYGAAVRDADAVVTLVRERAGTRPIAVVADHGHSKNGGHGGTEADVAEVPFVLAGPGVRAGARAQAAAEDVAPTLAVLAGLAVPAASAGGPAWDAFLPEVRAARGDGAAAVQARTGRLAPAAGGPPLAPFAAAALLWAAAAVGLGWRWGLLGLLVPACAIALLVGRGDPLSASAVDHAGRFAVRIATYCLPAAALLGVALVRASRTTRDGARKAAAFSLGAAGPWLVAATWAGFRPYPDLPGPLEGFLPVVLAVPATAALSTAALCLPVVAWFDKGR